MVISLYRGDIFVQAKQKHPKWSGDYREKKKVAEHGHSRKGVQNSKGGKILNDLKTGISSGK